MEAIDLLSRTVLENADKADAASRQARTVSSDAEASGTVMGEATAAMARITQSSAKISNIIGLIDNIAFQTNLLALNASVEAARAGAPARVSPWWPWKYGVWRSRRPALRPMSKC